MGKRNYLIEGGSRTGKTSIASELERRGFHVVHGDRVLAYRGNPQTGEAIDPVLLERNSVDPEFISRHHLWNVDRVRAIAADITYPMTFFCGGSRNFDQFIHLFDKVFVLEIDLKTLNERLDGRPNEWGSEPTERALILRQHVTRELLPPGISIDTAGTLTSVVDEILSRTGSQTV